MILCSLILINGGLVAIYVFFAVKRKNLFLLIFLFPILSTFLFPSFRQFLPVSKQFLVLYAYVFLSVIFTAWGILSLIQAKRKGMEWTPYLLAIFVAALPLLGYWLAVQLSP